MAFSLAHEAGVGEEARRKELEWLQIKRQQDEQEELLQRALERQLHHQSLTDQQQRVLDYGPQCVTQSTPLDANVLAGDGRGDDATPKPVAFTDNTSDEEKHRMAEWQEIKRQESENQERLMRQMETQIHTKALAATPVDDEESELKRWQDLRRRQEELEEQNLREMERRRAQGAEVKGREAQDRRPRQFVDEGETEMKGRGDCGTPPRAALDRQPSDQREEATLRDWEEIKRRESEEEERMLRQMERELQRQRLQDEHLGQQRLHQLLDRGRQDVDEESACVEIRASKDSDHKGEDERMRRLQTDKDMDRQRRAEEASMRRMIEEEHQQIQAQRRLIAEMTIEEEDQEWQEFQRQQGREAEAARLHLESEATTDGRVEAKEDADFVMHVDDS